METIVITPKNKKSIPFLKHLLSSLKEVESVQVVEVSKSRVGKSIDAGLKDVKAILSGRKKGKSLDLLLNED